MSLTRSAQRYLRLDFTLDDALPTRMPVYVNSVVYLFGATALMALAWIVISGVVLTLGGPTWYHTNAVGRFANSVHFWSVQLFFVGLVLHFITKFFLGACATAAGSRGWPAACFSVSASSRASPASCCRPTGMRSGS